MRTWEFLKTAETLLGLPDSNNESRSCQKT